MNTFLSFRAVENHLLHLIRDNFSIKYIEENIVNLFRSTEGRLPDNQKMCNLSKGSSELNGIRIPFDKFWIESPILRNYFNREVQFLESVWKAWCENGDPNQDDFYKKQRKAIQYSADQGVNEFITSFEHFGIVEPRTEVNNRRTAFLNMHPGIVGHLLGHFEFVCQFALPTNLPISKEQNRYLEQLGISHQHNANDDLYYPKFHRCYKFLTQAFVLDLIMPYAIDMDNFDLIKKKVIQQYNLIGPPPDNAKLNDRFRELETRGILNNWSDIPFEDLWRKYPEFSSLFDDKPYKLQLMVDCLVRDPRFLPLIENTFDRSPSMDDEQLLQTFQDLVTKIDIPPSKGYSECLDIGINIPDVTQKYIQEKTYRDCNGNESPPTILEWEMSIIDQALSNAKRKIDDLEQEYQIQITGLNNKYTPNSLTQEFGQFAKSAISRQPKRIHIVGGKSYQMTDFQEYLQYVKAYKETRPENILTFKNQEYLEKLLSYSLMFDPEFKVPHYVQTAIMGKLKKTFGEQKASTQLTHNQNTKFFSTAPISLTEEKLQGYTTPKKQHQTEGLNLNIDPPEIDTPPIIQSKVESSTGEVHDPRITLSSTLEQNTQTTNGADF
jgi:hypothetical protein